MTPLRTPLWHSLLAVLVSLSLGGICSCTQDQGTGGGRVKKSTAPSPSPRPGSYKKAYKTENPNRVISPFPPHNVIDISENPKTGKPYRKGAKVKDPSADQIFLVP